MGKVGINGTGGVNSPSTFKDHTIHTDMNHMIKDLMHNSKT